MNKEYIKPFEELIKGKKCFLIDVIGTVVSHPERCCAVKREGTDNFLEYYKRMGYHIVFHSDSGTKEKIRGILKENEINVYDFICGNECTREGGGGPVKDFNKISLEAGIELPRSVLISDNDERAYEEVKGSGLVYLRIKNLGVELLDNRKKPFSLNNLIPPYAPTKSKQNIILLNNNKRKKSLCSIASAGVC